MTQHEVTPTSQDGPDQELQLVTELIHEKLVEDLVNDAHFAFDADGNVVERVNIDTDDTISTLVVPSSVPKDY